VFSSSPGTILREIAVPKSDRPPKEMQREKAFIELVADLRDTVDTFSRLRAPAIDAWRTSFLRRSRPIGPRSRREGPGSRTT
jgi:hypothetical protein